ncbi:maleylpyruvate isomerase family mycothiol-dependent enzyme [Streptomyces sp. AV19]|uniref:maleylpyruvate isomerase family mycothiol-dependent enzyme n=1 Tax=Streptomyces sp. AV19 TaxID=2793068 RepID=UPI0018FE76B7|nr:maleylpyruvate isomerase family mycothiol-dependent enzyme [Streptomyces sp. AV19]MBH1937347.1 maleylpyruvate isomerase family mycothiol-dependent enzyme [Streptomyces sp. AV19]MDG4533923.1 maleylpyruvate isomerase family mycothiol-dependent enzyme [Streptomyces sp. AV19]
MASVSSDFERHCEQILSQTDLLLTHVAHAATDTPIPTCPGWNLGNLLRHLAGTHAWATGVVAARALTPVPEDQVNDVAGPDDEDPAALAARCAENAGHLAATLREAGPDTTVWTAGPGGTTAFWARRMAHETAVHRADAAFATGARYALDGWAGVDALDEWIGFSTSPEAPPLRGPGWTLHFSAGEGAEWFVDLTGPSPVWRRGGGDAAVSVRGGATDLLLLMYGRPVPEGRVEVRGDGELFARWRAGAAFWLE